MNAPQNLPPKEASKRARATRSRARGRRFMTGRLCPLRLRDLARMGDSVPLLGGSCAGSPSEDFAKQTGVDVVHEAADPVAVEKKRRGTETLDGLTDVRVDVRERFDRERRRHARLLLE